MEQTYTPRERKNIVFSIAGDTANGVVTLLTTGTLWQGFLLYYGLSNSAIGAIVSAASLAQTVAMLLNFCLSQRIRNPIKASLICSLPNVIFLPAVHLLCRTAADAALAGVITVLVFVTNLFSGMKGILSYQLVYILYRLDAYGWVSAWTGAAVGIVTTVAGVAAPLLLKLLPYETGMLILFLIGTIFALLVAVLTMLLKPLPPEQGGRGAQEEQNVPLGQMCRQKNVTRLLLPNLARGVAMGIVGCITIMAAKQFDVAGGDLALLASVAAAAAIGGNLLLGVFGQHDRILKLCVWGGIVFCASAFAMAFAPGFWIYLAMYALMQTAYTLLNSVLPVIVTRFVSYRQIAPYSSLRMAVTNCGSVLAGVVTGRLLDAAAAPQAAVVGLLVAAGLCQLYCCIGYCKFSELAQKNLSLNPEQRGNT